MAVVGEDTLRAKLYSSLQKKGILDSLKSQLRNSLIIELHSSGHLPPNSNESSVVQEQQQGTRPQMIRKLSTLQHQIAHYIITDYLQSHHYQYTLSTYLPEAGVQLEKLLPLDDVCQVLGLTGKLAKTSKREKTCLLLQLLQELPILLKQSSPDKISREVQTEREEHTRQDKREETTEEDTIERRMITFQRDCETRNKRTLELEMTRFKDKELSLMRLEERNRYLKELTAAKEQLEQKYQERVASSAMGLEEERTRLRKREAELERELFSQRQLLLNEMESLKLRETELKRQSELDKRTVELEREKTLSLQQLLSDKEDVLTDLKKQYEQMVEAKVERYKVEQETRCLQEGKQMTELKAQLEAHQKVTEDLRKKFEKTTTDLQSERETVRQLYEQLHTSSEKQSCLSTENKLLQEKLKQVAVDNPATGRERVREVERELHDLKKQYEEERAKLNRKLSEHIDTIRDLKSSLEKSSRQQLTGQKKFEEHLRESRNEISSLQHNNKILKEEVAKKVEAAVSLHQRLSEMTIEYQSSQSQIRDLQEHIDGLHTVLTTTGKEKPKKKHSPCKKHQKPPSLSTPPTDTSPLPSLLVDSPLSQLSNVSFSDASAQLLAEARATFARMEKESEEMAKSYQNYQLSSTLLPSVTPHQQILFPPVAMTTTSNNLASLAPSIMTSLTTPLMMSSSSPIMTSLTTPLMMSSAPPITVSLTTPPMMSSASIMTSSAIIPNFSLAPPTMTSSAPVITSTPPTMTSSAFVMMSPVPPTMVSSALVITSSASTTMTSSAPPTMMSSAPPTMTSSNAITISVSAMPISTTLNLDSYWRNSVTTAVPKVSVAMTTTATARVTPAVTATRSVSMATAVSTQEDHWENERQKKLEIRKEQERKERERVQQELLNLQKQEQRETAKELIPTQERDQSSHHHHPAEDSDDTTEEKEKWTMEQYLLSVQQQTAVIGAGAQKQPLKSTEETVEIEPMSAPTESLASGEGSDPFENW